MPADQGDAVAGVGVGGVGGGPGPPPFARGAQDGRGEAVVGGAEGVGGEGGEVEVAAAGLAAVDLLQAEDVGVEVGDGGGDAAADDGAVVQGAAVQEVEGGQAHVAD